MNRVARVSESALKSWAVGGCVKKREWVTRAPTLFGPHDTGIVGMIRLLYFFSPRHKREERGVLFLVRH
jgi:hypothetical protein